MSTYGFDAGWVERDAIHDAEQYGPYPDIDDDWPTPADLYDDEKEACE